MMRQRKRADWSHSQSARRTACTFAGYSRRVLSHDTVTSCISQPLHRHSRGSCHPPPGGSARTSYSVQRMPTSGQNTPPEQEERAASARDGIGLPLLDVPRVRPTVAAPGRSALRCQVHGVSTAVIPQYGFATKHPFDTKRGRSDTKRHFTTHQSSRKQAGDIRSRVAYDSSIGKAGVATG